jgi:broad specificity phosphatase PhoE
MKTIIFIRTAPYNYKLPGRSLYQSLDEIGLQIANPSILKPTPETRERIRLILEKYKPDQVFCSAFIRSQETAHLFSRKITITPQLNEIRFSMRDFSEPQKLPINELNKERINGIRYKFSVALLNDKLQEKQREITERITAFKRILDSLDSTKTVLCCSHGFIMKLYENFLFSSCKSESFRRFVLMHNWRKSPFQFLSGFVIFGDKNSSNVTNFLRQKTSF